MRYFLRGMGWLRRRPRPPLADNVRVSAAVDLPPSSVASLAMAGHFSDQWWTQFGRLQMLCDDHGAASHEIDQLLTSMVETAQNIDVELFRIQLADY